MRIIYEATLHPRCPVDKKPDVYKLTLTTDHMILVEILSEYIKECATKEIFQEDLTEGFAREFMCEAKTVGYHSGIKTTVIA
jgi:hypothetical protein